MTIANGSVLANADLNALTTTQQTLLATDAAQLPVGFHHGVTFANLVASTVAYRRKHTFIMPADCYLDALAVTASDFTAASTITTVVTADGALANWPLQRTGGVGAGFNALSRILYDNTKTRVKLSFDLTAQSFRVFPRGTTVVVTMSTTSVATPSQAAVCFAFRQYFQRL